MFTLEGEQEIKKLRKFPKRSTVNAAKTWTMTTKIKINTFDCESSLARRERKRNLAVAGMLSM
jgi:hypothetical protein